MNREDEAKKFLKEVGMPEKQQTKLCALALLALACIKPADTWRQANNDWLRIHDIIQFVNVNYGETYAENSRETFRKQALHHFRNAALIEDNGKATNSPNYRYRLTAETVKVLQAMNHQDYTEKLAAFSQKHESLISLYASKKKVQKTPVMINEQAYTFSPGKHNVLQKAILEEFAPRFAPHSECLYVGDTTNKEMVKNQKLLQKLGITMEKHGKLPDVILYRADKNWLYFIEAVTSVGPMSPKRIQELKVITENVTSGIIYITAFPDMTTYKRFVADLAWDTEVWLADNPDHMIHLNGNNFMGPHLK